MIKLGISLGQLLEEDIERIFLLGNHEWSELNLTTRMMKLGIGEGRRAQGMSDPPSQLIGQSTKM
jgi:hypothetical protein